MEKSFARIDKKPVKLCISFPGKTFLIGEYAVMKGGPALLVNTSPRFRFQVQHPVKKSLHPFHKDSPAGLFIEENKKNFSSVSINYMQAYGSGFGLSGAEFNCVYLLKVLLKGGSLKDISCFDILEKYTSLHSASLLRKQESRSLFSFASKKLSSFSWQFTASLLRFTSFLCRQESRNPFSFTSKRLSRPRLTASLLRSCTPRHSCTGRNLHTPSGADLVSQWLGKVCIFSKPSLAESIDWPFKDLSFALIQTGENLKTWKHLENLKQKDFSKLKEISLKALEAVRSSSESLFLQSIQNYQKALEEQELTHPSTKKILQKLDSHPEVLAVKGCGAMGAEVIAVFFKKDRPLDFLKDYKVYAGLKDLDQGVLVDELS